MALTDFQTDHMQLFTRAEHHAGFGFGCQFGQQRSGRITDRQSGQIGITQRQHPGTQEVRVRLVSPQRATVWKLDDRLRVQQSGSLVADLKALLGPSCVSA